MQSPTNYPRDPQTYAVIGAAMEVHKEMGCGFLEAAYQEAMTIEMTMRAIPFLREAHVPILYKGHRLNCPYQADFIAFDNLIIEVKAIKQISDVERAQVLNYLKATGFKRALLLNFGSTSLEFERLVHNYEAF